MKQDKELVGILRGFDDYLNMVLDDVIEQLFYLFANNFLSEIIDGVKKSIKYDSLLLNGNNICFVIYLYLLKI